MPPADSGPGVALVTGSRTGIGLELTRRLLESGLRVFGCSRGPAALEDERYVHIRADVAEERDVQAMVARIRDDTGRLDIVINNAGVASMNHALLTDTRSFERIIDVNLKGTFLVTREAARLMQRRRFGRIVNFSTVAVPLNLEGEAAYVASKSGVEGLTRVLARELAPFGITVNAIGPPPTDTHLIEGVPAAKIESILGRLAIKERATFDDIWNAVEFLIRPASRLVTGQVLYLGGIG